MQEPAGYSKRTLVEKLGIKPGQRIALLQSPPGYAQTLGALPAGVVVVSQLGEVGDGEIPFVQFFTTRAAELATAFPTLKAALARNGALWVSWPKQAARVPTDLDENIVRAIGLELGLVDVKVAAVDNVWSGLKFVYRKVDR